MVPRNFAYLTDPDIRERLTNQCITDKIYQFIKQRLRNGIITGTAKASFLKIVLHILAWNVDERLSASEVLEALRGITKQISMKENAEGSSAKRQQETGSVATSNDGNELLGSEKKARV